MFSCLLTEGQAGDMKGMFVTYLGSNIEALAYPMFAWICSDAVDLDLV